MNFTELALYKCCLLLTSIIIIIIIIIIIYSYIYNKTKLYL